MAFAQGDQVAVGRVNINAATPVPKHFQPPKFGMVTDAVDQDNLSVLWEDGVVETGIVSDFLDSIENFGGTPAQAALLGRVVQVDIQANDNEVSPSFAAQVIDCYRRDRDTAGTNTEDVFLVKTLTTGAWLEVLPAQVSVLPGR